MARKLSVKWKILAFIVPVFIVIDQWTKVLVIEHFYVGKSVPILDGFFHLTYVRNKGAAFGFLADAHSAFRIPFFVVVPLVALGVIGYLFRALKGEDRLMATALSLVLSGAIGNLIDRIRLGYVVDFLDFFWGVYHYPAFNVADSAICVGVGLMMWDLFKKKNITEASRTMGA